MKSSLISFFTMVCLALAVCASVPQQAKAINGTYEICWFSFDDTNHNFLGGCWLLFDISIDKYRDLDNSYISHQTTYHIDSQTDGYGNGEIQIGLPTPGNGVHYGCTVQGYYGTTVSGSRVGYTYVSGPTGSDVQPLILEGSDNIPTYAKFTHN